MQSADLKIVVTKKFKAQLIKICASDVARLPNDNTDSSTAELQVTFAFFSLLSINRLHCTNYGAKSILQLSIENWNQLDSAFAAPTLKADPEKGVDMKQLLLFIVFMYSCSVLDVTAQSLHNKFRWRDGVLQEITPEPVHPSAVHDLKNCTMCPRAFKPICASNGKWYHNPCFMACEVGDDSTINILYEGICKPEHMSVPPPDTEINNEDKVNITTKEVRCISICPNEHDPVCASNNQWYENRCLMKCIGGSNVTVLHQGKCRGEGPGISGTNTWNCTTCSKIYDPVCATNGQWYYNPCVMNCTVGTETDIKILYRGKCILFL